VDRMMRRGGTSTSEEKYITGFFACALQAVQACVIIVPSAAGLRKGPGHCRPMCLAPHAPPLWHGPKCHHEACKPSMRWFQQSHRRAACLLSVPAKRARTSCACACRSSTAAHKEEVQLKL
jgi:hypothetical protein